MTEFFWMFTMRWQGTLGPRKVDKYIKGWLGGMARQDALLMKAVPVQ